MSHSTFIRPSQSLPIRRTRIGFIALWALQIVLAVVFLFAGGSKLAGAPAIVALLEAVSLGQWFRYATGVIEVASAVALFIPSIAPFGALLLVSTMGGAIATHLFIVGGSPVLPVLLMLGSLAVLWAHRDRLSRVVASVR